MLVVLLTWLVLPLATNGARLAGNGWVHGGLTRKLAAARARRDKVVLLGGSNVLFGLSAARLEKALGIPAVNLGQHAGLGRAYILAYGAAAAQPGDTVVLSLEYALWERARSRETRNYYVLAHDIGYLYRQPPLDVIEFLAGVRFVEWTTLLAARAHPWDGMNPPGRYQLSSIDTWGDETANTLAAVTPALRAEVANVPVRSKFVLDARAIGEARDLAVALEAKGARLVVTFPGLLREHVAWEVNREFYGELISQLRAAGLVIAGTPEESAFDTACLFDGIYHPIRPCALERSDRLASQLRALGAVASDSQRP